MKIILVGLSSSGKTTTAKYLECHGIYKMIDIDAKIKEKTHMTVREFYRKNGSDAFRKMEFDVLQECIFLKEEKYGGDDIIISTGGGLLENKDAIFFLNNLKKKEGDKVKIFFLNSSLKTLWARLSKKIKKNISSPSFTSMFVPAFLEEGAKNISLFKKCNALQKKDIKSSFLLDEHGKKKILRATKRYFKLIYKKRMANLALLDCIKIKVKNKSVVKIARYIERVVLKDYKL